VGRRGSTVPTAHRKSYGDAAAKNITTYNIPVSPCVLSMEPRTDMKEKLNLWLYGG